MQRLGEVGLAIVYWFSFRCTSPGSRQITTHMRDQRMQWSSRFSWGFFLITEGRIQRYLSNRFLGFVGELSYGIYLVHILCLNAAEKVFPPGKGLAVPGVCIGLFDFHYGGVRPSSNIGKTHDPPWQDV